jgi:hypothetical protein
MTDYLSIFNQAVDKDLKNPSPQEMVTALVTAEKQSHRDKPIYKFEQFLGEWYLYFINGTNKSRSQFGSLLKDGFFLPPFIPVKISYSSDNKQENSNRGRVVNTISVGLVQFTVEGPCKFIPKKNILAFDFTYLTMFILGKKIFSKNIRGGKNNDEKFFTQKINYQAFFSYFVVTEKFIIARGRGGGLALWKKIA